MGLHSAKIIFEQKEKAVELGKKFKKMARQAVGKIGPEDIATCNRMATHTFYNAQEESKVYARATRNADGTWMAMMHGEYPTRMTDTWRKLGDKLTQEEALEKLESFEKEHAHLKKCFNRIINLPHPVKIRKAMAQRKP